MTSLEQAIVYLEQRRAERVKAGHSTRGTCLGDVRWALGKVGLHLPAPMASPKNTAIANFEVLSEDPEAFGWKAIHHDEEGHLQQPCLIYFRNCGVVNGRVCGHIAILKNDVTYANEVHKLSKYWQDRIVGAFVPVD